MSDITRIHRPGHIGRVEGLNHRLTHADALAVVVEESLDRTSRLLAGFEQDVYKAVGSAVARALATGRTVAKKVVTDEYAISQSEFLARTKNINRFVKRNGTVISAEIGFRGYVIPLLLFDTKVDGEGRVVTKVKRSGTAETLDRAFVATVGNHNGVFERKGTDRHPIEELFGPSTAQMMYSNEKVFDAMEEKMVETYEKRLDHEILRILNGWGG